MKNKNNLLSVLRGGAVIALFFLVSVSYAQPSNFHTPTSGSDSLKFTADVSTMAIYLFNPNGGTNHVLVHDITSNTNVFNDDVSSSAIKVTGFTSGHSYFVLSASGSGGTGNFSYAVSSHANSTSYPLPFWSYTQFYTNTRTQGPSDGVVVIIAEEPTM